MSAKRLKIKLKFQLTDWKFKKTYSVLAHFIFLDAECKNLDRQSYYVHVAQLKSVSLNWCFDSKLAKRVGGGMVEWRQRSCSLLQKVQRKPRPKMTTTSGRSDCSSPLQEHIAQLFSRRFYEWTGAGFGKRWSPAMCTHQQNLTAEKKQQINCIVELWEHAAVRFF